MNSFLNDVQVLLQATGALLTKYSSHVKHLKEVCIISLHIHDHEKLKNHKVISAFV
jgi:hypothetical protein